MYQHICRIQLKLGFVINFVYSCSTVYETRTDKQTDRPTAVSMNIFFTYNIGTKKIFFACISFLEVCKYIHFKNLMENIKDIRACIYSFTGQISDVTTCL